MAIRNFLRLTLTAEVPEPGACGRVVYVPDPCGAALLIEIILRIRYREPARSRESGQIWPGRGGTQFPGMIPIS
jgi:hypothetical protein